MKSKNDRQEKSILMLLRLCTFLMAAVSFWATAQGMREYTFPTDWQAYAASLGVQGLLLGLNFSLPSFWKKSKGAGKKLVLILLTLVVLACSSWFSYLYIAGQAYGQSWDVERRLLAQDIYRSELFAAEEYTEEYAAELENSLSDQVVELYQRAKEMGTSNFDVTGNINLAEDLEHYAPDGSAAREIMMTVTEAVGPALEPNAAQDVRQRAQETIEAMQTTMQSEIDSLDSRISDADARIQTAERSLTSAQNALRNAPENVDIGPYLNAVTIASNAYTQAIEQQSSLVRQREEYQSVLQRTGIYSGLLGMSQDGVSTYFVGSNLREIQRELFGSVPDSDNILKLATDVFEKLQSGIDLDTEVAENADYQQFLSDMNRFINDIEKYRAAKLSNAELQELINQLANGEILSISGNTTQAAKKPEDDKPTPESGEQDDGTDVPEQEPERPADGEGEPESAPDEISDAEPSPLVSDEAVAGSSAEPAAGNGDSHTGPYDNNEDSEDTNQSDEEKDINSPTSDAAQTWETAWSEQFNTLKSKISALPVYISEKDDTDETNNEVLSFDRAASAKRLDRGIRNYLTAHNPAQEGIIYLTSPYWAIALFSLCVALLLDISAFITGVIIDRVSSTSEESQTEQAENNEKSPYASPLFTSDQEFEAAQGLNRYIFLTGDYQCINDIITYNTIEQGEMSEIEHSGAILKSGLYVWNDKTPVVLSSSALVFKGSDGGPQDGVYEDSTLSYDAPVLTLSQNKISTFLGHTDSHTPVYRVSKSEYEVFPVSKLDNMHGNKVVIALDKEGKMISGIYIVE